jgi:signal transduction histidine kinase
MNTGDINQKQSAEDILLQGMIALHAETRTPLSAIEGYTQLLLQSQDKLGKLTDTQKEFLEQVAYNGKRLRQAFNILDCAKLRANKVHFNIENVDLNECADIAADEHRSLIEEKHQTLIKHYSVTPMVLADKWLLIKAISNLLDNAYLYTNAGGQITISTDIADIYAKITITDTGIGIADDDQAYIFDEYYRARAQMERKHYGFGLGLTLAKGYVELLGGTIDFHSVLNQGSSFWIQLKLSE